MGDFFMRKICLIGGDKRNLELAKFLLEDKENNISIFANEKMKEELTNKENRILFKKKKKQRRFM